MWESERQRRFTGSVEEAATRRTHSLRLQEELGTEDGNEQAPGNRMASKARSGFKSLME